MKSKLNPWSEVTKVTDFSFLCCPECSYKNKNENLFESHAVFYHPRSHVFFKPKEGSDVKSESKDFEGDIHEFPEVPDLTLKESEELLDPFVKIEADIANEEELDALGDEKIEPLDPEVVEEYLEDSTQYPEDYENPEETTENPEEATENQEEEEEIEAKKSKKKKRKRASLSKFPGFYVHLPVFLCLFRFFLYCPILVRNQILTPNQLKLR